ncbi:MAG: hypothetical protein FD147_425 [Chloroflexi bacterium]|nr:MAG: hypothetical protein FD147_425 [Chloroflexota bacterium]MBA4376172.1 hypothetical protein [Anaerolinea sp.]
MKKLTKVFATSLLITLLVGIMAFAFPTQPVAAVGLQGENPSTQEGNKYGLIKQRLENLYIRAQDALAKQAENIARHDDIFSKAQARIDALKAKGIDTSPLENALFAFEGKIPAIESSHENAASILAVHDGFGDNGKVTDIEAARVTLESARDAMKATRKLMFDAVREFAKAVRDFRAANTPAPTPEPGM